MGLGVSVCVCEAYRTMQLSFYCNFFSSFFWATCWSTTYTIISSLWTLLGPEESSSISKKAVGFNHDAAALDTEREFHPVTTASPVNIPHHQPFFKSLLLHEHLLTRDFQGYQHFFQGDGSPGSTVPGSLSAPDSGDQVTQSVPHEDAPAYSDIATTATAAATSPLTTFSPTTPRPHISVTLKKSAHDWTRREQKMSPTTDSLTTQVPLSGRDSVRSRIPFPAEAPSSVNLNPPSTLREHGTTKASTATPTSAPAGRRVLLPHADAHDQNVFITIISSSPTGHQSPIPIRPSPWR